MTTELTQHLAGSPVAAVREYAISGGGGTQLHASEWGDSSGPAIVFIHGWSQSELCWSGQIASLLADRFRIVTFDLRGHGRSAKPAADSDAYIDGRLWADDLAALIDQTQLTRPVLVAWSYGGFVVGDYLRAYGDGNIAAINLVGAATLMQPPGFEHIGPGLLENVPGACSADLAQSIPAIRRFLRECTAAPVDADLFATALCWNMLTPPDIRYALLSREIDESDVFSDVAVPVLVTHGREDRIVLPSMSERILASCPTSTASWYEDVGHMPFVEAAGRFNDELGTFAARATG